MRDELWYLLGAISEGLVVRGDGTGIHLPYLGPDQDVSYQDIYLLAKWGLIEKHIGLPPNVSVDGAKVLRERFSSQQDIIM